MKTLFISIAAVIVFLISGCQENSITDPILTDTVNKAVNTDETNPYVIPLEGLLKDPYPVGNSYYKISGQVEYSYGISYRDPLTRLPQNSIYLHLKITAEFWNFCSVCSPPLANESAGFISEETYDNLLVAGTSTKVEKSFIIQGREDGMILKCRFLINNDHISLNAMWLALSPQPIQLINHN